MDRMDNFYCLQPESAAAVLNDLYLAKDPQATPSADVQTKSAAIAAATGAAGRVAVIPVSGPLARNTQLSWWGDVAATGYDDMGLPIPGRFPPVPDLAASGLWSTPKELLATAKEFIRAFKGESVILREESAWEIAKPVRAFPWTGPGRGPFP